MKPAPKGVDLYSFVRFESCFHHDIGSFMMKGKKQTVVEKAPVAANNKGKTVVEKAPAAANNKEPGSKKK